MQRARKVSNVHGGVHFKQKQNLTIYFTGSTLPSRKQSRKDAEGFIVDKTACYQHATLPKLNFPTTPQRNLHNSCKISQCVYNK